MQVNVADAKRDLSKLIRLLETKAENTLSKMSIEPITFSIWMAWTS